MKVTGRTNQAKRIFSCPVEAAQDVIGGKWKPIILWHLHAAKSPCRFGVLRRAIPNATEKMIVQHIRELDSPGIRRLETQIARYHELDSPAFYLWYHREFRQILSHHRGLRE